jgi:hypothetical protein
MKSMIAIVRISLIIGFSTLMIPSGSVRSDTHDAGDQVQQIKEVIEKAYIQGIHKKQNMDLARMGFHPDFTMFVLRNNTLIKAELDQWFRMMGGSRNSKENKPGPAITHNFLFVDITGPAAVAKLEVYKDKKLFATDYFSLYQFKDHWKIVMKIFTFSD